MKPLKLGKHCYDQALKDENEITVPAAKSKYRQPGGGRLLHLQWEKHCKIGLQIFVVHWKLVYGVHYLKHNKILLWSVARSTT